MKCSYRLNIFSNKAQKNEAGTIYFDPAFVNL